MILTKFYCCSYAKKIYLERILKNKIKNPKYYGGERIRYGGAGRSSPAPPSLKSMGSSA